MKNFIKSVFLSGLFMFFGVPILCQVNAAWGGWFDDKDPIQVLDNVVDNANKNPSEEVQNTRMDTVTSRGGPFCKNANIDGRYTLSNTLCYISDRLYFYLQYVVYIALAVATLFLIWNGFQLVVSDDKASQIKTFKKNMMNIGIWVILVVAFYIIIDIFVSIVNLIAD